MKDGLKEFDAFLDAVSVPSPNQLPVIASYATEEGRQFAAEVAAGIQQIEHYRTILEAIHTLTGEALGRR